ncbi:MAG: hypothetical protein U9N42_00870 [Campylobacterota bacterium]|nr:hypothetical protein [Campylobacterota bacterium]
MIIYILISLTLMIFIFLFFSNKKEALPPINLKEATDELIYETEKKRLKKLEPIYELQTHNIKYLMYNPNSLKQKEIKDIHEKILKMHWNNEPFYTEIFYILLILDKDNFFIQDPNSKVVTSRIRDQKNKMVKTKSYKVISTIETFERSFYMVMDKIINTDIDKNAGQNLILVTALLSISKSKQFEDFTLKSVYQTVMLQDNNVSNVDKDFSHMFNQNIKLQSYVTKAINHAIEYAIRHPYVEKDEDLKIKFSSKLPKKQLLHI